MIKLIKMFYYHWKLNRFLRNAILITIDNNTILTNGKYILSQDNKLERRR